MKRVFSTAVTTLMFVTPFAFAINPVPGLYAGLILGGSFAPTVLFNYISPITLKPAQGNLKYSVFGNLGGQVGYRINQYRIEGEVFFNSDPYKSLQSGPIKILSSSSSPGYRLKGQTNTAAIMLNGYYDFISTGDDCKFVPYVGAGIGYAYLKNNIKFYYNNIVVPNSILSKSVNSPAVQGIAGVSYFVDDFANFALDVRYFTSKNVQAFSNTRTQFATVNLSVNGSFDCL